MKFSDITGQDVTTLTEAPMGFLNTLKTGAKALLNPSLSGRKQAQGQFKTGRSANQIYGEFYKWLGSTQGGAKPTTSNVIAFLQQQGYGQPALAAAQKAFPSAPAAAATVQPPGNQGQTTQPAAAPSANFSKGQTQPPAPSKVNYSGMPQPKPLPKATSSQGAYSVKNAYAQPAAAKPAGPTQAEIDADRERIMGANNGGANENRRIRESRKKIREDVELSKDQLSAIFTAVAQSGAAPGAAQSTGNSAAASNSDDAQQSAAPGGGNSAEASLPQKLNPEQLLQYYTSLQDAEKIKVKQGIAEIDNKLKQNQQQQKQTA
jgi:hypothetical protein